MTTDEVLKLVEGRGLKVVVNAAGELRLRGDPSAATPDLKRVLALPVHRDEIARRLGARVRTPEEMRAEAEAEKARREAWLAAWSWEYQWPDGRTAVQDAAMPAPDGACWWRWAGSEDESDWSPLLRPVTRHEVMLYRAWGVEPPAEL